MEHVQIAGSYAEQMRFKRAIQRQRREVLAKVAEIYKKEKEEFYEKYRYFKLHKWKILKAVK